MDPKSPSRSYAPFRIREDQSYFSRATGEFITQADPRLERRPFHPAGPQGAVLPGIDRRLRGPGRKDFSVDVFYQYKT